MRTPHIRQLFIGLLLAAGLSSALAAPATRPAPTRPAATRPADPQARRERLIYLTRRSIELLSAGKNDEAEAVLSEALLLSPHSAINLYNMACLKALKGHADAALDYLERSATYGFTDFLQIEKDPDLSSLRQLPRYKEFLAKKDQFQRHAAERIVNALRGQFGDSYRFEVDQQDKLIFATNTDAATLDALKKWLTMQARSQWADLFEHRPDQYVSVIVPSARDYRQIVDMKGVGGFYNHDMRMLIAQRLGHVMTHEFTHALHSADLDPLGQQHPTWVSEGLATMYEGARFEGEKLVPGDTYRLLSIQYAARGNRLIPLEKLVRMSQGQFVGQATLAYGQSGSLMLYLHDQGLLRKFYETFKKTYDQDKTGKAALEAAAGKPLAQIEKDWKAWMLQRKAPPLNTGPHGPVLGIRFAEGIDGLRVAEVVPAGPAARAGVKPGDVLVGVDNEDIRDEQALMPLLATHRIGEEVTLKLRRGSEYREVDVKLVSRDDVNRPPASRPASRK